MSEAKRVIHPLNAAASSQFLLDWEQQRCDEAVADIFGYHSLQWGMPMLQGLRMNRMPHRWLGQTWDAREASSCTEPQTWAPAFYADSHLLPLADACMDLVILPHTLELSHDPHATLREVVRVLVPDGRVLIFGLNPWSLWGVQHALEKPKEDARHDASQGIGYLRLRDWLQLMALEVVAVDFGAFMPYVQQASWLRRWRWLDRVGAATWPILGAVYCVVAIKRVHGMRLMGSAWSRPRFDVASGASVAQRNPSLRTRI